MRAGSSAVRPGWTRASGLFAMGLAIFGAVWLVGGYEGVSTLSSILPGEIQGWVRRGEDVTYDRESLFDYLDGGAEVYRAFGVREVLVRRYSKPGQGDIVVDIFEMGSPADAYGVYHHDLRRQGQAAVGNDSEYLEGAIQFWKGPYFVSVMTSEENDESRGVVLDLAKAIASAIPGKGAPPWLINLLPAKDRLVGQVRYFHDHTCLNSYYFIADRNVLRLHADTEGVLARYGSDQLTKEGGMTLLLVKYPSRQEAGAAHGTFLAEYLQEADPSGLAPVEGGKWAAVRCYGELLVVVLDARSRAEAESTIVSVLSQAREGYRR